MRSPTPARINVSVACGPVPCDTEEGRSFLQQRQALFGKVCFPLCMTLFILLNLTVTLAGEGTWANWFTGAGNQLHLGVSFVFLGFFLLCRRGTRSHGVLAAVDLVGTVLIGVLVGVNYWLRAFEKFEQLEVGLLSIAMTLLARAVIIPSSAPQTALTSTLATIPVVLGFYLGFDDSSGNSALFATVQLAIWSLLAVAIASIASYIIYGLQQEVREARQLGQYTIEERIGEGGMGEVYKANHAMLRRPTAIKLLRAGQSGERSLARFEREVQLTSRLTHPNTIAIYDYGRTPEGQFYYAMEYLDGLNLEELVSHSGPQPPSRVIHILRQVSASLIEAHGIGLIHRDIKPANIILCERGGMQDVVKVVDFGLVKELESHRDANISGANTITGTPLYMSPEAIRSPGAVDARSDLYALGAVGYYLLSGEPLFESTNFMEICGLQLHTMPEAPSSRLARPLPRDLEDLILRSLAKDSSQRPQSASEFFEILGACQDSGKWTAEDAKRWWMTSAPPLKGSRWREPVGAFSLPDSADTVRFSVPAKARLEEAGG